MPEFWVDWRHQYGLFWLVSQTILLRTQQAPDARWMYLQASQCIMNYSHNIFWYFCTKFGEFGEAVRGKRLSCMNCSSTCLIVLSEKVTSWLFSINCHLYFRGNLRRCQRMSGWRFQKLGITEARNREILGLRSKLSVISKLLLTKTRN